MVYANRPIERFWFLETVARMPYFVYISMVGAGTCIAVLNGMNGSLWGVMFASRCCCHPLCAA